MITWIRHFFSLTTCTVTMLAFPSTGESAPRVEREAVEEFATSVLEVYRAKDVSKFLSMLAAPPPESVIERIAPGTPPYEQLFGEDSRQWLAVKSWSGEFGEVRMDREAYIVIRKQPSAFGPGNPDVLKCVRLKNEDEEWLFDKFYIAQQAQVNGPEFSELKADSQLHDDLNERTASLIRAYQRRDARRVKAMSVEAGPWALRGKSGKSESERLFDSSEMEGVTDWQGEPGRVFTRSEAEVKFGESEKGAHWLQLVKVGGQWRLKNIKIDSK